jgi:hypothetical protein
MHTHSNFYMLINSTFVFSWYIFLCRDALPKDENAFALQASDIFQQMDVRGDGEVSWDDFSAVSDRRSLKRTLCIVAILPFIVQQQS